MRQGQHVGAIGGMGQGGAAMGRAAPSEAVPSDGASGKGRLRALMPVTASIVDDLRRAVGTEWADRIVAAGMAKRGVAYFAERCPDGQLRTVGHVDQARRVELRNGALVWVNARGEAQPWPLR